MIRVVEGNNLRHQHFDNGRLTWSYDKCTPDPEGEWIIRDDGIYLQKATRECVDFVKVTSQVIYIQDRKVDLDTGMESVTVIWEDGSRACECTIPRKTISSAGKILELADRGYAVTTDNAKYIVRYLAHLLDYQQASIPIKHTVSSCGTKMVKGLQVFMVGSCPISSREPVPEVSFNDRVEGSEVISKLCCNKDGDLLAWVDMAREVGDYPIAAFAVMASFLPPLLRDLDISQNPIIDYGGKTSTGKSTTLVFAASVWGDPAESDNGLVRSWSGTETFFERYGTILNELPVFLDESHIASPREVKNILYQYANGTGRGRGKALGMQASAKYRGVMLSAGESRLTDLVKNGGIQARVISFTGSPFGPGKKDLVDRIYGTSTKHYGLAGMRVLEEYLHNREELLPQLRINQKDMADQLGAVVGDDVGRRLSKDSV